MKCLVFVFLTLVMAVSAEEESKKNETSATNLKPRSPRQFNFFPENFSTEDDGDSEDSSRYDRPKSPINGLNYYKQNPYYGYPPVQPQKYYGNPSWKNFPSFESDQAGQLMFMDKQETSSNTGFLSSLTSDPQIATAIAAIVPLVIILFAVLPALLSYFQQAGGVGNVLLPTFSPVTTIADSRLGRALTDKEYIESTIQDLILFAEKAISEDSCVQQTVCQQVLRKAGEKNIRTVATAVGYLGKDDLLQNFGAGELFEALKNGNCKSVCNSKKTSF
ncbi:hypothetical protein JTE90_018561 [Oedothorax gibbosus]|uniref:Uncharacterized protein n=1 Tax=Oedothorax gibbosus TaxID=931172 RepID=A0AAV6U342_9ARAC|nr:hypothetical protein JTE90_018561 [Oedothorax gibbosus]